MKKILILCNSCIGLYKFRKELIERLLQEKFEVYISTPYDNLKIIKELEKINCQILETNIDRRGINPIKDLKLLFNYFKLMKKVKPNIVLTYTIKSNLYGGIVSRLLKIPYIVNITGMGTLFQNEHILTKMIKIVYKFTLIKSKCVFFQNQYNLEYFKKNKLISKNYKLVKGSGVNLEKFNYEIKKLNFPIEILFIGRIMQEKGIEEFLEVAKKIKEKYKDKVEFNILGQYEEDKYKDIIKNLENQEIIKYLGISNDVRNELKEVHCLVNPSWHEGMSNVLLEAGAMKIFLIASDIPGCREIVINNKTGFTFAKQNIDDLENKMEQFINLSEEEYEKYINSSYKHVKDNFDRKIVIEEYLKIINL